MEASKVTITSALGGVQKLTNKKKYSLRKKAIADYIKSRPFATEIRIEEFMPVIHVKSYQTAHAIVTKMVKEGFLQAESIPGKNTKTYVVNDAEVKVKRPADTKRPTFEAIETLAKDFAWDHNSDSLRDFIKYAKEKA